ncbi:MAG: adenylosuccinate synthase [Candidatus Sumerlaeia bacterium]|nr:adenylosuccinate synthase [Candidatus Sumerlaeia bacterium]
MAVTILVGCQWGDEGKGKIVDVLSSQMDVVARYQGGNNAGHTVVIHGDKYVLHILPSGILHDRVTSVIGNGVVIDPRALVEEINEVEGHGFGINGKLMISEQAHLILPQHAMLDRARELSLGEGKIGTTGKGIGSAYGEKMARRGLRVCDLRDSKKFTEKYRSLAFYCNEMLEKYYGQEPIDADSLLDELLDCAARIRPFIADTVTYLNDAVRAKKQILCEGAQGVLLDVDFGTYPFVTSSNPSPGGACTGLGISPRFIDNIMGVVKAYTTRVGSGPLPTELLDQVGEDLRKEGGEFGATTGRPRRCGWFDAPAVRRSLQVSGCTEITLTKLDVLSIFDEIPICTSYETSEGSTQLLPFDMEILKTAKPVYESMPGWKVPLSDVRDPKDLPKETVDYIKRIEKLLNTRITMASVGPDRRQTLCLD